MNRVDISEIKFPIEPPPKAPRHKWPHAGEDGYRHIARCLDGNERFFRVCKTCGITRVTVIPARGYAWHEWKVKNGDSFQCESTPPCVETKR